jgi:hypothetical protein
VREAIEIAAFGCADLAILTFIITPFVMLYARTCAAFNLASDRPFRWSVVLSRYNAVWYPDQLSPKGLRHRALYLRASLILRRSVVAFALCLIVAAMADVWR